MNFLRILIYWVSFCDVLRLFGVCVPLHIFFSCREVDHIWKKSLQVHSLWLKKKSGTPFLCTLPKTIIWEKEAHCLWCFLCLNFLGNTFPCVQELAKQMLVAPGHRVVGLTLRKHCIFRSERNNRGDGESSQLQLFQQPFHSILQNLELSIPCLFQWYFLIQSNIWKWGDLGCLWMQA